ncbi:eCIS core domain-containing protein [Cellulomonas sp. P5_C5]
MTRHVEKLAVPGSPTQADAGSPEHAAASPLRPAPVAGLAVGRVDDPAEVAAEARATSVVSRLRRFGGVSRPGPARSSTAPVEVGRSGGAVRTARSNQISSTLGRGAPLSDAVRRRMEEGFGTSLGHVRVHDDPSAAQHSAALGAKAFTVGNDVFLGAGVDPTRERGEHVLAHEIAHVLDEGGAQHTPVRREPGDSDDEDGAPAEMTAAEIVAAAVNPVRDKAIGSATTARSNEAGLLWTGLAVAPVGTPKGYWVSADGQKRYRPPAVKPSLGKTQSNFESGPPLPPKRPLKDIWASNAHLDITD